MHNHHDTEGTFPYGAFNSPQSTWTFRVLPYLEQTAIFNALNMSKHWYQAENNTVVGMTISPFLCPSDPGGNTTITTTVAGNTQLRKKGNYVVNWGNSHYDQGNPPIFNGPAGTVTAMRGAFRANSKTAPPFSMRDFVDGLSNTLFMSEMVQAQANGSNIDLRGDVWANNRCAFFFTAYTTPNSKIPDQMDGKTDCAYPFGFNPPCMPGNGSQPDFAAARSMHPGVVQVLLGDGSVRSAKNSINIDTWRALSTPNGNEPISSSAL